MITGEEIKVLDTNAAFYGTPPEKLMERAGKNIATFIRDTQKNPQVLFFCGLGNNGGDGFVASRYLAKYHQISLFLTGREQDIRTNIASMNFTKLKNLPLTIFDIRSIDKIPELINESTVIVDAMLGIGLSGELREPYNHIVHTINHSTHKTIISVDVPTGLGTRNVVQPNHTLTFHDQKHGMTQQNSGNINIVDIGIPEKAQQYVGPGELAVYYPRPKKESHKGENGRVLVIGGGPYTGAPALSGLAALRTGADLVFIATPKETARIIATYSPNLIVKPLTHSNNITIDDADTIMKILDFVDTVVIGPGIGKSQETNEAVNILVPSIIQSKLPLVIDADALTSLQSKYDILKNTSTIITPHAGEFAQFTGESTPESLPQKISIIEHWAKKLGINIFLKGSIDILSNGTLTKLNDVHNEAMTVGGTGDVLAGIIAALLSKKTHPMNAMRIAAFLNGYAGNIAFEKKSYGLCATDIIEEIPSVLKNYI